MQATSTARATLQWHGLGAPATDGMLCALWIPFAVAAWLVIDDPERLTWLVAATLTFSFAHQPLTMWLVYGDTAQFASRRSLFTWSPVVLLALVVVGLSISEVLVALVAATWNAGHTLQQRYGITRIYGRKVGQADGGLEHAMLWSWLALTVALVVRRAGLAEDIARSGIGGRNRAALDELVLAGPLVWVLVMTTGAAAAVLTVRWISREATRPAVNPLKWLYLASTAVLLGVTVLNPIVGFVGYVGSHAAEYVVIVHHRLTRATSDQQPDGSGALFTALRLGGPLGFMVAYAVGVGALVVALDHVSNRTVASTVLLVLGGLHLLHDGFIWKLRRPEVARVFT